MTYKEHYPVLKRECTDFLFSSNKMKEPVYIADLTFGGGGHSLEFLKNKENISIKACDRDIQAVDSGLEIIRKKELTEKIELIHKNFSDFPQYAKDHYQKIVSTGFHGILLDLGVSTHQLKSEDRGFSFKSDGPLDMRMDRDNTIETAENIVNEYPLGKLKEIFYRFGEESNAERIASKIVDTRKEKRITTCGELEDLIFHCYPKRFRHGRTHPATKCFQALRIYINDELTLLSETIPWLIPLLKKGGRLLVISFHSLEDRIVKKTFKNLSDNSLGSIITKKPVLPGEEEIEENSRSRSAKLRVIEKN